MERLLEIVAVYKHPDDESPGRALEFCRQRLAVVAAMYEIVPEQHTLRAIWARAYELLAEDDAKAAERDAQA